ncbi:MAG TPA: hypothetical protein VF153_00095, partial [Candidatus Limnocylindria bacterium]
MRLRRVLAGILALALIGVIGYSGFVGYEGSRQAVSVDENRSHDCRTPMDRFGWAYEAINYDIADDAVLRGANA